MKNFKKGIFFHHYFKFKTYISKHSKIVLLGISLLGLLSFSFLELNNLDKGNDLNTISTIENIWHFTQKSTDAIRPAHHSRALSMAPCDAGQLGGIVFNDFNGNGINDSEPGIENISVEIYGLDNDGTEILIETVTTDTNGEYVFTDAQIVFSSGESYRIEFSGWQNYFKPSLKGSQNNGSTIVVNAVSCNNDFALVESDSYCQDNPHLVTSCYVEGDQGATSGDVLVSWEYDVVPEASESDDIINISHESLSGDIGSTFGLAFHKRSKNLFASAHMKRFAGFAPGTDPATIFIINNPSDNTTNGIEFLSLEDYFGVNIAGNDLHDFSTIDVNPSPLITQNEVLDPQAFDAVGKYALGDIELNTAQDTLYAVNLFDRRLYAIPIGPDPSNPVAPSNASEINTISLTSANIFSQISGTVGMDELRPFALKNYREKLFVGMVGSGQSGGDLLALVFEYNPMDGSMTKVLESSLVYNRGCAFGFNNGAVSICAGPADWNPWVSTWPQNTGGGTQDAASVNINFINSNTILALEEGHPQPMLTDIEFDASGNMILAIRDRVGDQGGTNAPYPGAEQVRLPNGNYVFTNNSGNYQNSANPNAPPGFVNLYVTNQDAFGDLLRATKSGSTYTINLSDFTDNTTNLPNSQMSFDNCIPGESIFNGDCYNDGLFVHEETSMGGMAVLLHQNTLIAPAMDPRSNAFSNGVDWFDLDGSTNKIKSITILTENNSPFGKAYGLGEMELQCELPPIQLGDYVWSDENGDGIQNPNENGINGVTVTLYNASKIEIGSTTTASGGFYLFDNSNTSEDLEPEENYFIVFGEGQFDSDTGLLTIGGSQQYSVTLDSIGIGSQPGNNDSDIDTMGTMFGGVPFTTLVSPEFGADHNIDAGFVPKPIVTITSVDILCGEEANGGSISVTVVGGIEPYIYNWSEDSYDGMSDISNVPPDTYSLTLTDGMGCEVVQSIEIIVEPCPPNPCESGEVGGSVFNDNNANGIDDGSGEDGFSGIKVQIFECDQNGNNVLIETVSTDLNGDYHFNDPSIDFMNSVYQIVFSCLPEGFISSSIGPDNGSDVQTVTQLGCGYNYGIVHPDFACATPDLETSVVVGQELFSTGTLLGPGIALVTCGTIIDLPQEERHTVGLMDIKGINTANDRPEVNPNGWYHPSWNVDNIGNVFGIDYDTSGNIYVTASSHYSHIYGYILGPDASNYTQAIIKYGALGGGDNDLGAAGTIYKLDAITGVASVFAQLPQQAFTFSHFACEAADPPLPRTTGPGLGNIVYDQVNDQFFVSNFEDGKIYRLDVDGNILNSFDPQTLSRFSTDDGSNGWASDAKPYGLAINADGTRLYFGTHELNTTPALFSVDLDSNGDFDGTEIFHQTFMAEGDIGYLFAVEPGWVAISDLEFLPNGQIMVGLRTGCAGEYATSHNHGATFYIADQEGDGIYDNLISNPDIQYPNDGTANDDGYGGIGIWDKHDGTYDFLVSSSDTRMEEGPHGLILFPHDFTNGNAGFSLQPSAAIPYLPSFNTNDFKGVGGDLEVFSPCGEAPVQIGNFAWIDINGNGIQDACESPLENLTVKLYSKPQSGDPELVATTMTNENGEYYFSDSMNVNQSWESTYGNIEKDSSYYIIFCGDSYNSNNGLISTNGALYALTQDNEETSPGGDMTDSDVSNLLLPNVGEFPGICITAGETDFTFDVGFIPKPDLALIQVLDPEFDSSNLKFLDSVKFKITVFNQSILSIDSLEITDYVPNGFTFDETITGNEMWSMDGANVKTVLPNGLAPGAKDSVCIYLILERNDDPLNWVNVVEISNGWSNGVPVEDCDSALNDDPNDNGGSEINTEADDVVDGDGSATEPGGDPLTDQDNVDPATVPICDLALINTIVELPESLNLGDTIKYAIIIENQGTEPATNIEIDYTIPNGLEYLDSNDDLVPEWSEGTNEANANITEVLNIGEKDTICIYLSVTNVPANELTGDSWTTFAEIASYEDPSVPGVEKSDVDSTPDGNPTNDSGGNPDDDTNDVTSGDGTGDPENPQEDSNPDLDEDDHDPAIIYVCDAATIIYTDNEDPILYGDTIKFNVLVFNQGNGPITNIDLNDFLGSGLEFVPTTVNDAENWNGNNDQVSVTITEIINPGESDTTCLELVVVDVIPYDENAYLQTVEIEEFEDPDAIGVPKEDIDSTPDTNPENDSGGNPDDNTDDEINGDGTGDPENPDEDSDPLLDEDDNDPVLLEVFDLALDKVVQEDKNYSPGEKPVFEITIYNQGNVAVDNYEVVDYLRDGFSFSTMNNPGWNQVGSNLIYTSSAPIMPGQLFTITLELTIVIPVSPMGVSDWWNYAEISEADDNSNMNDPDPTDADSNPNDSESDDNMVVPDGEDDNVITENGNQGGDEDDHDPAKVIVGYDLALRKTVSPEGPYNYDDTLTYTITVFNQGGLAVSDIDIYDSIPCGFIYIEDLNDWEFANNMATTRLEDVLGPGEMITKDILLVVQRCDEPAYGNYLNTAEISDFSDENGEEPLTEDIDSTPNDNPSDDGVPNDNAVDDPMDEDDHDIENIEICDLALVNKITEIPAIVKIGDTVKYEVIIYNQGNSDANSTFIDYTIPNGLSYLPVNTTLSPAWLDENDELASVNTDVVLAPGDSDTLCLYLQIENVATAEVTEDSWTTFAEITAFEDSEGEIKTSDADSTPDDNPTNDPGGNPEDDTDNVIDGDGSGDPENPQEDSNPDLDEDDHDPAIIHVNDVATIIDTEEVGPFEYGDSIKYYVYVHNQGNTDITNIDIQSLFGEGLAFIDSPVNTDLGWSLEDDGELSLMITDMISSSEIDTICLIMELVPEYTPEEETWIVEVEVEEFEILELPGEPQEDIDSTPDSDPENDPGGNSDDDTNDVTDGSGQGDPDNPIEDSDPALDEDDQDVEDIDICDLALINTIEELEEPVQIGDTVQYKIIVVNQGNVGANSIDVEYLVPNGLIYLPINDGLDPQWNEESPELLTATTSALSPGGSDTLCLYLELTNVPTDEVTEDSWTTIAEIVEYIDEDGNPKVFDVDSDPDDDFTNDPGGNPNDETDDQLEGDGTGDPESPEEDSNPELDEDDNDPAKVYVCDVATIIYADVPDDINYYDTLKYNVVVSNQGNGDITNILLADHLPEGLELITTPSNTEEGWVESETIEDAITTLYDETLSSGESDTICLEVKILPVHESSDDDSWLQIIEVVQFEDPEELGEPKKDLDSSPDDDPNNDPGGNPEDETDNVTDGKGTGDPENPDEDMNPELDEDDHDPVDTKVFDVALIMQIDSMPPVLPVVPGDVLKFIVVVSNQGNTPANNVEITNYLMDENLTLAEMPGNDGWDPLDSETNEYTIDEEILPGQKDTVCIYLEVLGGAMTDIVTYSEISGSTETDEDCYDIDSTPNDILEDDEGGTPESNEDNHIEDDGVDGNEDGITDEDDHDPAMLDGQDLALIMWADQKEPVLEGQDVKFIIRVTNQGNITNENIKIVNYLPVGFELSINDDNGWQYDELNENQLTKTLSEPLLMDSVVETCILLTVQEGVSATDLINYAEIVSSNDPDGLDLTELDIDSSPNNIDDDDTGGQYEDMPDCTTEPIIINDDNYDQGAGVNGEDEDDHDPAWVHVFDLASIIYTDRTIPIIPGDEIKFNVEVHNQGNMSATEIDLLIHIPEGFTLSENDSNNWSLDGELLSTTYTEDLVPESIDTVCLLLEVLPDFMLFDLIPIVEITSAMDTLGNVRDDFDLDSSPNESPEDDEGGEIFTEDDDSVQGNGEMNDDEDDHDPAVPPVMDLAIKIITVDESPKKPGDIVKFSIMVYNQGSMTPSEFTIENYVPEGLIFMSSSDNNGWLPEGATNATFVYDEELLPLTSDTLCIYLEVAPDANPMNVVDMVEIIEIIDQMDNDVSLLDIDSESDNSNENDKGNDLYSVEDNKIDENGRSDEDEDDHDQAFVNMCQGISCFGHMNISVDQNCEAVITPSVVLTGDIFPDHVYDVEITNSDGEVVSNMFTGDDIGELFTVSVSNPLCNGNSCWMTVLIEDKWAPQIICQNDTLSCVMAYDESSRPTIIDDNCSGGELILLDEIVETLTCDSMFTSKITRVWVAKDEAGNMSEECTQEISLLRTNLDSIMPVMNFMLATNNAISCSSGYETDANGHPSTNVTGVPKLRLGDGSFIDLYPFEAATICNGFVEYTDEVLPGSTSCVTKILRTWIVGEWWCSQTNDREFIQLIEIVDFEGPSVSCPSDVTLSTTGFGCESYAALELPVVSDACNNDIRIDLSTPIGFYENYSGEIIALPVGVHELTYRSYDGCNNRTDCSFFVTVRDEADPIAICDQNTAVGIGLDNLTKVTAESIDDGSFDECGEVSLEVARMDESGFEDFSGFGPSVDITCADVGNNVMVGLLVTDAGGNTNMCMVSIEVQDKIDAQFTCPEDMEVECNFPYDPDNLSAFFGEVVIYDNCPESNTVDDRLLGSLNSCGSGVLTREIRLFNAQGDQVDYCTQQITFRNGDQLHYSDITPPVSEVTVTGCGIESIDPSILGMPIVPDGACQQTAIGIENDTFPFTSNGACLKILRTFKVIDWCIEDGPGSILEPFEFTQTIKVNNTVGPEIANVFADTMFCSYEIGCGGINIDNYLTATSSDDCTSADDLLNRYEVKDSEGEIYRLGTGLDASGYYDVDEYTVRFISEDKCGNQVFEESTFESKKL